MKIGVDIRTLMDAKYSGVSQYTYNVTRELLKLSQEKDNPPEFKFFYNSGRNMKHRVPDFIFRQGEIKEGRIPNKVFNYGFQKTLKIPKLDKKLGVDVFWMPHFNFTSLSSDCKSILTVHDLSFLRNPEFFNLRKNLWHKLLNIKKIIRDTDHIIAISKSTKRDIIELCGTSEEKISVVHSGVDAEFRPLSSNEIPADIKEKYGLPDNFILFLGTVEPRKNAEGVIRAFNIFTQKYKTSPYHLVLAGMKGWKNESVFEAWRRSSCRNKIKFLDYIPDHDKVFIYNSASFFIFPSFYEGFGLPPLEAMACGKPVIASFSSSLPEVVGDAGLMADPYNVRDIFEAIKQMTEDEKLREELGRKGLKRAQKFRWPETARRYWEIINNIRFNKYG